MESLVKQAVEILESNMYVTISTSDEHGQPWISPVFFYCDEDLNLYWMSSKRSLHSRNIEKRSDIAMVIFDSHSELYKGVGVYLKAKGFCLVNPVQMSVASKGLFGKLGENTPALSDFKGKRYYRLYKAVVSEISITTDEEVIEGEAIDKRVNIEKGEVKALLKVKRGLV